jgi:D-alanyl-lipoteichoic acid acyltransferase DltB (MBOAT superfamily)
MVALLSNLRQSNTWRTAVLAIASVVFLCLLARSASELLPLAGFLLLAYTAVHLLQRGYTRIRAWSVVLIVLAYVCLKKYTFLPSAMFLQQPYFVLGLSYIFFRVLQLVIDAGSSSEARAVPIGGFLLHNLNFLTLVSGPIQRYDDFARDQFASTPVPLRYSDIGLCIERLVRGFFKVNVLATLLDGVQSDAMDHLFEPLPPSTRLLAALQIALTYPFFLYCNFSGYIDIVISLARLMRVRLPENFDHPFAATSVLEFWNRWHMTLSNWLKTYVYNPLLMLLMGRISSVSLQPYLGVVCFFATFFLIGVWHGRTSEFIFFGLLTGAGVSVNKLWQVVLTSRLGKRSYRSLSTNLIYETLGRGLNLAWFAFTLFWFWGSWADIGQIYSALPWIAWLGVWVSAWLISSLALIAWDYGKLAVLSLQGPDGAMATSRYARVVLTTALATIAAVLTGLLHQPAPAIVYKAF